MAIIVGVKMSPQNQYRLSTELSTLRIENDTLSKQLKAANAKIASLNAKIEHTKENNEQ